NAVGEGESAAADGFAKSESGSDRVGEEESGGDGAEADERSGEDVGGVVERVISEKRVEDEGGHEEIDDQLHQAAVSLDGQPVGPPDDAASGDDQENGKDRSHNCIVFAHRLRNSGSRFVSGDAENRRDYQTGWRFGKRMSM